MENAREFSGSSLNEALQSAAAELGVPVEQIKYRICTQKSTFFGSKNRLLYIEAWISDGQEKQKLQQFLDQLIRSTQLELEYELKEDRNIIWVYFKGNDYKLVLFQNGNLLNAIQYLANRLYGEDVERKIFCECHNYRKKREQELISLVKRNVLELRRSGKEIVLEKLNPFERRVVHMAASKFRDLETESIGDNFLKDVILKRKA